MGVWKFTVNEEGDYALYSIHAAGEQRPTQGSICNADDYFPMFGKTTGGWEVAHVAEEVVKKGIELKQGRYVLRFEARDHSTPHIKGFELHPMKVDVPAGSFDRGLSHYFDVETTYPPLCAGTGETQFLGNAPDRRKIWVAAWRFNVPESRQYDLVANYAAGEVRPAEGSLFSED